MTTLNQIYSERILELAANIPHCQRLPSPHASATTHSKLCGSTVTVDICMDGDTITDYGQRVKACLLGQSSAAVVGAHAIGATVGEIQQVTQEMRDMLKSDGPPPSGKWSDLAVLEPVRDFRARHASTLLVFDALEEAIAKIKATQDDRKSAASTLEG